MNEASLVCWLALLAPAPLVLAADLAPPTWRGQPGTAYQSWSFNTDANPAAPEAMQNPYGSATADITVGFLGSGWLSELEGLGTATGFWDLGGSAGQIVCSAANRPLQAGATEIWVQVTYWQDISQAPAIEIQGATRLSLQSITVEESPTGGSWILEQSSWELPISLAGLQVVLVSNPTWGTLIDAVVLDARSTVDPAGCPWIFGDLDADDDVDEADTLAFQECYRGPGMPYNTVPPRCRCVDADGDTDVDQSDFGSFQRCLTASDQIGDPGCR